MEESLILEVEIHRNAMPSGPFDPDPMPKPKVEEVERIILTMELYPSASNGLGVNVVVAGIKQKAIRLAGGVAMRLKSLVGVGGGTVRVVSRSAEPVPGSGPRGVQFQEGCDSCGVRESEAGAGAAFGTDFGEALAGLPSMAPGDSVGAAVGAERGVHEVLGGILANLASLGAEREEDSEDEADSGYGEGLGGAEGAKSDAVLITVCSCLDKDGTGYIDMVTVAVDDGRNEQQDHDVSHAGGRF